MSAQSKKRRKRKLANGPVTAVPSSKNTLPASASSFGLSALAVIAALGLLAWLQSAFPGQPHNNVAIACGMLIAIVAIGDLFARRVYRQPSAGLTFGRGRASPARVATKLLGLCFTIALIAFAYWLFPEYHGSFYNAYWHLLAAVGPWVLAAAVPYFWIMDGAEIEPRDSYWHLGRVLLWRTRPDWPVLATHFGGWAVKAFFLPLMIVYLTQQMDDVVGALQRAMNFGGIAIYDVFYNSIFLIDVMLASVGYCLTLRVLDGHIRSVDRTGLGWGSALVCYEPFWSVIGVMYLHYNNHFYWGQWLAPWPNLRSVWGGVIIAFLSVYVLSTVAFGLRFSNLTYRGTMTAGPYRFTKHPAYIAKNISWWMISIPFVSTGSATEALRLSVLLGLVNVVYFLRGKTEERHLKRYPEYRAYAAWIEEHGLFARLRRHWSIRWKWPAPRAERGRVD